MDDDKSVRQIYASWAVLLTAGAALVGFISFAILEGDANHVFVLGMILVALSFAALHGWYTVRRIATLLREPTSAPLIRYYEKLPRSAPNRDVIVAHACALVSTFYGEFERAEAFLDTVRWEDEGRLYEAMALQVRALIAYWRDRDYLEGLAVAREAQALGAIEGTLPGAALARRAYEVLVAVGKALYGMPSADDFETLRDGTKLPVLARVIALWGLAVAYDRSGDRDRSERQLAELRRLAPHCAPLVTLDAARSRS